MKNQDRVEQIIAELIDNIGEDKKRLSDTPARVAQSYKELFQGYSEDPAEILSSRFPIEELNQSIELNGIEFHSICEHHMLPISGTISLTYMPRNEVVGISKIVRLIECFAKRMQLQERMTKQIANAMQKHLNPQGVLVEASAVHYCMLIRGVKKSATLRTSHATGIFCKHHINTN
jgi:GTP cyclohydrolase I